MSKGESKCGPVGAARRAPGERRDMPVSFRCREHELDAFRAAAAACEVTVSEWARMACRRASGLPIPGDRLTDVTPMSNARPTTPTDKRHRGKHDDE